MARTGTEYPIMKLNHQFINNHPESEPFLSLCHPSIADEYIKNDCERANNNIGTVVYDYVDISPFYENVPGDMYIDEKDLIELPAPT